MEISPDGLSFSERYKVLTGAVVPRPIAVVSTVSGDGIYNVAPFSYYSIACHDPMAISICVAGGKPDRSTKDTLRNILETKEFVVSAATERFAEAMVKSSSPLDARVSEFDFAGLTPVPAMKVKAPRVSESPFCFECELLQVVDLESSKILIGKVVQIHAEDGVMDERFRVDFDRLEALGRLAGTAYCRTRDRMEYRDERFFRGLSE